MGDQLHAVGVPNHSHPYRHATGGQVLRSGYSHAGEGSGLPAAFAMIPASRRTASSLRTP